MNEGLKQRLVGAIVLTCTALILWPVIFSESRLPAMDQRSEIPPMPEFEKYEVPEPTRPKQVLTEVTPPILDTPVVAEPAPADQPKAPVPTAPKPALVTKTNAAEKPKLNDQGIPQTWALQVASFSEASNAEELTNALKQMGYKAYTQEVTTDGGKVARVYIGPKFTRAAFDKDKQVIDKKFNVKSLVVPFEH